MPSNLVLVKPAYELVSSVLLKLVVWLELENVNAVSSVEFPMPDVILDVGIEVEMYP